MAEAYSDALKEQQKKNVWDTLASEATSMTPAQYATVTADIAGIFDPTPVSDAVGGILSLAQGDVVGALFSIGSMIPYAGDAVAKPLKIAKYAPKTAKAIKALMKASDDLAKAAARTGDLSKRAVRQAAETTLKKAFGGDLSKVAAARKTALDRVKKAMLDARAKTPGCKDCAKLKNDAGKRSRLQLPRNKAGHGKWKGGKQPADGNGTFEFDSPVEFKMPDGTTRRVDSVEYKDGFPDFSAHTVDGKHDLWVLTGDVDTDARALTRQMKETNPAYVVPDDELFVLHHFEDGAVGYVPRQLHDKGDFGGVAHTGSRSMMDNELF